MFDHFGDYMYSLLTTPLRQMGRTINQYYIFFRVVGGLFNDLKQKSFAVREASMIVSAPDIMLAVHGEERGLARLKGETIENYRERLLLKGLIAEKAGTNEGIRYLAKAFGYDKVEIAPSPDPEHWAEAEVRFIGGKVVLDDADLLLQELGHIKPARTLLHLAKEQRYSTPLHISCGRITARNTTLRQA